MKYKWQVMAILLASLCLWALWGNQALVLTEYTVADEQLPEAFDGFRIAQISDLHNARFGDGNGELLELLRQAQPDIIVITGDMVDSRRTDVETSLAFAREAAKIAPCYYVTGNHEGRLEDFSALQDGLKSAGVQVLRNEAVILERSGQRLRLIGMDDITFFPGEDGNAAVKAMEGKLIRLLGEEYTVLLSHRAELAVVYDRYDLDLVFSGHAHGGQIRIPFLGGLYAPDQGLFPAWDCGVYEMEDYRLVVSRGLGNSAFPLRFNNRPEIVVVTLENGK